MQDDLAAQPSQTLAQKRFYASEQCAIAREVLQRMVSDERYDTNAVYYKENALDFVERHLHYLSTHPVTNIDGYLSNLKLMTQKRTY